ncbi:flagellar basal-body MS-ring/collar protein FliF [Paenibacillus agilis]|uniref:Flagellar M-ring protein FliF n=1 Tax=Paenibacillus agilis TaxID=3020863 RepID=A0A559J288_9BACL|nr:flagellar basal-body MS-ring/collar protein FliF [Paenibacillus agilis]TVX93982.1 flagellar M-ring protein FliF [Paenibacillus agilis]
MNEKIGQYRERVTQYWNQYSKKQKLLLGSTFIILLLTIGIVTYQLSKTEYSLAFKDLNASDAAGIIEYLNTNSIPYQLSPDGASISVPAAMAAKAKVDVGAQGIVQNGSLGFDSFAPDGMMGGMTDNVFDVRYKDALNGEVERLLGQMEGVQSAQVLINLPQETVFMEAEKPQASASIVLQFKPGFVPDQKVIDGYFNLVSTAVPNLEIDNISMMTGNSPLHASSSSNGVNGSFLGTVDDQLAVQRRYERELSEKVRMFLASFVGPDKVNVLISSNLNFDIQTEEHNEVKPVDEENMKGIEISVEELQESFNGSGAGEGGVAGVGDGEVPNYPGDTNSGQTQSEKSQRTVNYEVTRIKKAIQSSPYAVTDLTIHAAVESEISDEQRTSIEKVLKSIVAAQLQTTATKNNITITDAMLQEKVSVIAENATNVAVTAESGIPTWVWYGAGVLLLLLVGGGIAFAVMRKRKRQEEEYELDDVQFIPTNIELPSIDLEHVTSEHQVRKQLEALAKKKPEEFVNLLRTWLLDDSR